VELASWWLEVENLEQVGRITFGLFEVDLQSGEIWKSGHRVRLQDQPFRVLVALLMKPGQVVTHSELHVQVWGPDTNVDIEGALAVSIKKIREALSDSADNPRFVETLTKRGYRFIAPVAVSSTVSPIPLVHKQYAVRENPRVHSQQISLAGTQILDPPSFPPASTTFHDAATSTGQLTLPIVEPVQKNHVSSRGQLPLAVASGLLLCVLAVVLSKGNSTSLAPLRVEAITHDSPVSAGPPGMEKLLTLATDGERIFTSVAIAGKPQLAAIDISTGGILPLNVPTNLASAKVLDISKDGSHLLLRSQMSLQSEQPLWIVPTAGGSALRVGSIQAHDSAWMPDGTSIVFASGNELSQTGLDGGTITPLATLPGRAFWLRWSPDGARLRFTLMDPLTHTGSLWELKRGSKTAQPIFKHRDKPIMDCCGNWTADGKAYIFQESVPSGSNLWQLKETSIGTSLTQLTNGPLRYFSPITARSGRRIFFYGSDQPSGLQKYMGNQLGFQPERTFLVDSIRTAYSRDRKWVAWTDYFGRLWRARSADGSEKIQLTPSDFEVFSAQWSPSGDRLAIMARRPDETWRIYLVSSDGGKSEVLIKDDRNVADPGWSADGQEIVFGGEPDSMGKENGSRAIELFNLQTRLRTTVPHSEGLFSPRWSPDGKWIAALSLSQNKVMLFDVANQHWTELSSTSSSDPNWSNDSKSIFVHAFSKEDQPILKISVLSREVTVIASSADFHSGEPADFFFGGLTTEDLPLVRPRVGTGNLYSLDLDIR
jgi:Tol biopolymer transport system component/DNA-binding winged helix-turn-helix (wHTH) protein